MDVQLRGRAGRNAAAAGAGALGLVWASVLGHGYGLGLKVAAQLGRTLADALLLLEPMHWGLCGGSWVRLWVEAGLGGRAAAVLAGCRGAAPKPGAPRSSMGHATGLRDVGHALRA